MWADDKGILANGTPEGQMRKVLEEYRESAEAIALYAIAKNRNATSLPIYLERVKAELGDQYITLVIHAKLVAIDFPQQSEWLIYQDDNKAIFNELVCDILTIAKNPVTDDYDRAVYRVASLAQNHGLTLRECVEHSYNVIARRTGKMQDGVFIKD